MSRTCFHRGRPSGGKVRHKRQALQDMARPLKQWLYKHRDNPYPTKTEKILLALGSQMTLVQVGFGFLQAAGQLAEKKEKSGVSRCSCRWECDQTAGWKSDLWVFESLSWVLGSGSDFTFTIYFWDISCYCSPRAEEDCLFFFHSVHSIWKSFTSFSTDLSSHSPAPHMSLVSAAELLIFIPSVLCSVFLILYQFEKVAEMKVDFKLFKLFPYELLL